MASCEFLLEKSTYQITDAGPGSCLWNLTIAAHMEFHIYKQKNNISTDHGVQGPYAFLWAWYIHLYIVPNQMVTIVVESFWIDIT